MQGGQQDSKTTDSKTARQQDNRQQDSKTARQQTARQQDSKTTRQQDNRRPKRRSGCSAPLQPPACSLTLPPPPCRSERFETQEPYYARCFTSVGTYKAARQPAPGRFAWTTFPSPLCNPRPSTPTLAPPTQTAPPTPTGPSTAAPPRPPLRPLPPTQSIRHDHLAGVVTAHATRQRTVFFFSFFFCCATALVAAFPVAARLRSGRWLAPLSSLPSLASSIPPPPAPPSQPTRHATPLPLHPVDRITTTTTL